MERTLFILKPEVADSPVALSILNKLDMIGRRKHQTRITRMADMDNLKKVAEHYAHLASKPFFNDLLDHMTSGDIIVGILEGPGVIQKLRNLAGATNPEEADPGTLRHDYGYVNKEKGWICNAIHASDSKEAAEQEIKIWLGNIPND